MENESESAMHEDETEKASPSSTDTKEGQDSNTLLERIDYLISRNQALLDVPAVKIPRLKKVPERAPSKTKCSEIVERIDSVIERNQRILNMSKQIDFNRYTAQDNAPPKTPKEPKESVKLKQQRRAPTRTGPRELLPKPVYVLITDIPRQETTENASLAVQESSVGAKTNYPLFDSVYVKEESQETEDFVVNREAITVEVRGDSGADEVVIKPEVKEEVEEEEGGEQSGELTTIIVSQEEGYGEQGFTTVSNELIIPDQPGDMFLEISGDLDPELLHIFNSLKCELCQTTFQNEQDLCEHYRTQHAAELKVVV